MFGKPWLLTDAVYLHIFMAYIDLFGTYPAHKRTAKNIRQQE